MRTLALLTLLLPAACNTRPGGGRLDPDDFVMAVFTDPTAVVIDVRTAREFAQGHLYESRLIDWSQTQQFDSAVSLLPRSDTYYIYCQRGGRSAEAAAFMRRKGLTVVELEGGTEAWCKAGLPLEKGAPRRPRPENEEHEDYIYYNDGEWIIPVIRTTR
ncbi:MAG: rhodanese-like domain-containing protein [Bacteroidaceae bacterium]